MANIEILAPVGSEEMLHAAVFSGADAVYLGFSGFNARTGAGNFDADSLKEAVRFCHARGVKVHVALNTTVYGGELASLRDAIRAVAASGADAVICQDLAVATLIGKIAPQLPRHGSTQMSVHTLQGALELKELGFTRVVLARELSLPEVEQITRHCGIETECFVHGALCMCVSGQCYMSAFLGGRSGNRGSCAGPCRLPFEANTLPEGKPGRLHHLSLKDNSVIDKLDQLQAIGVASAKIEGRLRTPEYVAAAVSACLAGREGRAYDRDLLKNAFSRSGFTSGYLDGKIDGTMFGVRSEADAELTKKTLPALRELYRRERSRVPVRMKLEIEEGGEKLTVTDADKETVFEGTLSEFSGYCFDETGTYTAKLVASVTGSRAAGAADITGSETWLFTFDIAIEPSVYLSENTIEQGGVAAIRVTGSYENDAPTLTTTLKNQGFIQSSNGWVCYLPIPWNAALGTETIDVQVGRYSTTLYLKVTDGGFSYKDYSSQSQRATPYIGQDDAPTKVSKLFTAAPTGISWADAGFVQPFLNRLNTTLTFGATEYVGRRYSERNTNTGAGGRTSTNVILSTTRGELVIAPASGKIDLAEDLGGDYGITLVIDHGAGVRTIFYGLSDIDIKAGQQVKQGQTLATCGKTTVVEMRIGTVPIDPIAVWRGQCNGLKYY